MLAGPVRSTLPAKLYGWLPTIIFLSYLLVIVLAQLQLNAIPRVIADLFG